MPPSDPAPVEITFRDKHFGRPPKVTLLCDVMLRNGQLAPRWFLLPANLFPISGAAKGGGVNGVEVFTLAGTGRAVLGRFLGTGGFQTLLLPARAEVRIQRLPIALWEPPTADTLNIEVIIASRLTVNGERAAAWLGIDPTSDRHADVSTEHPRMVGARSTTDLKEVPVSMLADRQIELQISLR